MKKLILLPVVVALFPFISNNSTAAAAGNQLGEALYKKHCIACHPDADRLRSTKNIIVKMRKPLSSMPAFEENKISIDNAKKIEDYIHQDSTRVADLCGNNMVMRK